MAHHYSCLVDPSEYDGKSLEGLFDGIPLRMHNGWVKHDIGAFRLQEDWSRLVRPLDHYRGGAAAKWSFVPVTVPECIPERLEIISYAFEFGFLQDDEAEVKTDTGSDWLSEALLETINNIALDGTSNDALDDLSGKRKIQLLILTEMTKLDRERALTSVNLIIEYFQKSAGRKHITAFKTLDDYISFRVHDCGLKVVFSLMTYGMAITIPEHEMSLCRELDRPAYIALALQNDLFSWEKEREAATQHGFEDVINAIRVLMQEHSTDVDHAKGICKDIIREHVAIYLKNVEDNINNETLSADLRHYIWALQFSISGNAAWSAICPRYNSEAKFSEFQTALLKNGVTQTLKDWPQRNVVRS